MLLALLTPRCARRGHRAAASCELLDILIFDADIPPLMREITKTPSRTVKAQILFWQPILPEFVGRRYANVALPSVEAPNKGCGTPTCPLLAFVLGVGPATKRCGLEAPVRSSVTALPAPRPIRPSGAEIAPDSDTAPPSRATRPPDVTLILPLLRAAPPAP